MTTLPKGWKTNDVRNIIQNIPLTGKKIKQRDYQKTGSFPIIDQGKKLVGGYTNKKDCVIKVETPVVVFGDHTRIVKYIDFDFAPGADGVKVLKPSDLFLPKLFYYFLKTIHVPNKGYTRHYKYLKNSKMPIPPLAVQKRIIPVLDKAEEIRIKNDQILEIINKFIHSIFQKLFGDPVKNPHNWSLCTLSQVLIDVQYGTSSSLNQKKGVPCLRMNNITADGRIDVSDLKYLRNEKEKLKYLLHEGDILFNRTNSKKLVGKTALFNLDGEFTFAGYLVRLVTDRKKCNPLFLSTLMNMPSVRDKIRKMAEGSVNQANISAKKIQKLEIFIPPIELQRKFEDTLHEVSNFLMQKQSIDKNYEALNLSLRRRAIRGELFV